MLAGRSNYYDFSVPVYENYWMDGVIHHNTAKSLTAQMISRLLGQPRGAYFEIQLNRFTEVDELFGPYDLLRLKTTGEYVRRTSEKLPEATVAFLDEYWNASSAVANSLHRLMNERTFDAGNGSKPAPLKFVVAASNIWPSPATGHENCEAAFDRFLLRRQVQPVRSGPGRDRLLWDATLRAPIQLSVTLSLEELDQAQAESKTMPWSDAARQVIGQILETVKVEAMQLPSDRRLFKAPAVVQAYAYCCGAQEVLPEHLEILQHVLWTSPENAQKVAMIVLKLANPAAQAVLSLLGEADQIIASVDWNPARLRQSVADSRAKLQEIYRKLRKIGKIDKVREAREYIEEHGNAMMDRATEILGAPVEFGD